MLIPSGARHSSLLPLVRPLLGQEVLGCLVLFLSANLDVSLGCHDVSMANELPSLVYILRLFIEVRHHRRSEVVALDLDVMLVVEL